MQTKANASKDRCNPKASKGNGSQQHMQSNADAFKDRCNQKLTQSKAGAI